MSESPHSTGDGSQPIPPEVLHLLRVMVQGIDQLQQSVARLEARVETIVNAEFKVQQAHPQERPSVIIPEHHIHHLQAEREAARVGD